MAGTRGKAARRKAPARTRGRGRGWWTPVLATTATGLVGLAFLPDLPGGDGTRAVDAASVAASTPATGFSSSGGTGSIVIPAPAVAAPPSLVVPRPQVVRQAIVPPYVPVGRSPKLSPPPAKCGGYATPRRLTPTVVPGAGSATVTFPADTSADVRGYRVQAVSQQLVSGSQPAHVVATAAQVTGCVGVTVTVSGLTSGDPYVFWVEEQQVDATDALTQFVQVGSSEPVTIG
jgi:hypothetical protein